MVATDGIWDNLYENQVQDCIKPHLMPNGHLKNVQAASNCISAYAEFVSYDPKYVSPWYEEARRDKDEKTREKYKDRNGGKPDDITVIVS